MRQLIPSGAELGLTLGGASVSIYQWLKATITTAVGGVIAFITGTGPGSATYLATGMLNALTSAVTSVANFGGGFVDGFLEALGIGDRGGGLWARNRQCDIRK